MSSGTEASDDEADPVFGNEMAFDSSFADSDDESSASETETDKESEPPPKKRPPKKRPAKQRAEASYKVS